MSITATRGARRRIEHDEEEHENEERWLVSFADMMTLLFCLFMVLFAISSVNTSKFESLKKALDSSFNSRLLSGGEKVMETGGSDNAKRSAEAITQPAVMPADAVRTSLAKSAAESRADLAKEEQEDFVNLKKRIDAQVRAQGLEANIRTEVSERGLVVRLLTDGVLFASGSAVLAPAGQRLLDPIGAIISEEERHPVVVEGHTDTEPIRTGMFPSNWELSGARAARVTRQLIGDHVASSRLSARQFAGQHPIATNATAEGRSLNRRVEIVLTRLNPMSIQGGTAP